MPQDTANLIDVLLLIFGVVIAGFAIGGAVQAWRNWSDHRRSKGTWVVVDAKTPPRGVILGRGFWTPGPGSTVAGVQRVSVNTQFG